MTSAPTATRYVAVIGVATLAAATTAGCTSDSRHDGAGTGRLGTTSVAASTPPTTVVATSGVTSSAPASTSSAPVPNGSASRQITRAPVALSATATFAGAVSGSITSVRAVRTKAVLPDEISGPGLAIGIRIANGSGRAIGLANAVVTLAYGASRTPGAPMSGPPSSPLPATLGANKAASGTYVFRANGVSTGTPLVVSVSYSPTAPRVVFAGTR